VDGEPELGIRSDDNGIHAIGRLDDGERVRVVVIDEQLGQIGERTLQSACPSVLALARIGGRREWASRQSAAAAGRWRGLRLLAQTPSIGSQHSCEAT
jgi:hypothetical protein